MDKQEINFTLVMGLLRYFKVPMKEFMDQMRHEMVDGETVKAFNKFLKDDLETNQPKQS